MYLFVFLGGEFQYNNLNVARLLLNMTDSAHGFPPC